MKNIETLEEATEKLYRKGLQDDLDLCFHDGVKFGVKWQAERSYSEEDMFDCWKASHTGGLSDESLRTHFNIWFEQFKKK
jgi:hypothetical protein